MNRDWLPTAGGFGAILLWSTTVALARSLSEQLGPMTAGACAYAVAALAALVHICIYPQMKPQKGLSRRYLIGCGTLFVLYMIVIYAAIGLAETRTQVLEVGLLNYLWPSFTILLAPTILGFKPNWRLLPGTVIALAGVILVLTAGSDVSWYSFTSGVLANPLAYSLAFTAAVSWALYSNLSRKWGGNQSGGAVPVFLTATALILAVISCFAQETHLWTPRALIEATYLGIATYAAYTLWDIAMRRGRIVLVAAGSYLAPLLSTVVIILYLNVPPAPVLWLGCSMLILGSILSWRSVDNAPR